jgi:hypothetical protein
MNATGSSEWDAIQTLVVLPGNYYEVADLLSNCGTSGSAGTFWTEWTTGNSGAFMDASMTVSATQIDGMFASPILFVAAQGSGTYIYPFACTANAIGSTSFSAGGNIGLFYGTTPVNTMASSGLLTSTFLTTLPANQTASFAKSGGVVISSLLSENTALYLSNITAPFTGGTGSSMFIDCKYYVQGGVQ